MLRFLDLSVLLCTELGSLTIRLERDRACRTGRLAIGIKPLRGQLLYA